MTYPPARYTGDGGEATATFRPASSAPDLTYPNGGTADYLATGAQTDLAYLVDHVRVAEGRPQVYGTQVGGLDEDGNPVPRTPIEDPDNVDARRAAAGLGTLEEYYEEMPGIMRGGTLGIR